MNGIILAGGKATRLDGINKGLIIIDSKPIIEHLIDNLRPFCKKIIIVANNDAYNYIPNIFVVSDIVKEIGPLGGIHAGLLSSDEEKNIVLSCDTPYINADAVTKIINNKGKADAVIAQENKTIHPLFGIYSKNIIPIIVQQINKQDFKLQNLLNCINTFYVQFSEQERKLFTNINTHQELTQLLNNGSGNS